MRNSKPARTPTRRLSLLILLTVACTPAAEPQTEPATVDDSQGFRIRLEENGCFGACSAYAVTLEQTGAVTWQGKSYVEHEGEASATVASDKALELWTRLDDYYRDSWEPAKWPRCRLGGSDAGSVTITLVRAGSARNLHREAVCVDGPLIQDLIGLEKQIKELTGVQRWIGSGKRP